MHEYERRQDQAREHIRATIMNEFCEVMRTTGLPPMVVMRLAAQSVGNIYREIAAAHRGIEPCPCGWQPVEASDIEVLIAALRCAARPAPQVTDLGAMRAAGTA
ncbi:hypothetical protein GTW25_09600 [Aliihoeflea aestuarii]|uniref:hypothetical protein n=1 Tax=Aliihoeflea aestuarii TaxID=453840 RepID=UPI002093F81C|nr:hypothetical protein [Aliihoeflea aestuarii]MCO6391281.1 hypothetical protein [Aliihoeflea aestuarii]